VERRLGKCSKGAKERGIAKSAVFGGVVFQGEAKAGKSWRGRGSHEGIRGAATSCLSAGKARSGAVASCGGLDAQSESNETEHRNRSKWARKRNGRDFRLSDKLKLGAR